VNDERDPQLSALYRASATEVPPRRLDEAILGAARAETAAPPPRPWWSWFPVSWALPVSAAAVAVLAVSVVLMFRVEDVADPMPQVAAPAQTNVPGNSQIARKAVPEEIAATSSSHEVAPAVAPGSAAGVAAAPAAPPAARPDSGAMALEARSAGRERQARDGTPAESSEAARLSRDRVRAADVVAPAPPAQLPPASAAPEKIAVEKSAAANLGSAAKAESARSSVERDAVVSLPAAPAIATGPSQSGRDAESAVSAAPAPSARTAAKLAAAPTPNAPGGAAAAKPAADEKRAAIAQEEIQRRSPEVSRAPSSRDDAARDLDPEKWLARIAQLRREGRHAEAKSSLDDFRKRHPDHPVPKHLE
jgi:hypothetical protein